MERFDAACLTDAKKEYTQRLVRKLKAPLCSKILDIFKNVKESCAETHDDDKVLFFFQDGLEKVPEWDDIKIQQTSRSVIIQTKCDYLEELLQAVFIVHTKILAVIQSHKSSTKSELKLPTIENFIFQCFVNSARELWKFAYLFKNVANSCEYQENTNQIEKKIHACIVETIEDMLPVRDILIEHVRDYVVGEESSSDEDEEVVRKHKLKKKKRGGVVLNSRADEYNNSDDDENNDMLASPMPPPAPTITAPMLLPRPLVEPIPSALPNPLADPISAPPKSLVDPTTPPTPLTTPISVLPTPHTFPTDPVLPPHHTFPTDPVLPLDVNKSAGEIKEISLGNIENQTQVVGNTFKNISFDIPNELSGGGLDDLSAIDLSEL